MEEKTISKNYVFNGKIMRVRCDDALLPNGKPCTREVVEHRGGASVLAVDNENFCYLVRQFRYPFCEEILEIPAGKLEVGENPKDCAIRELAEEAGLKTENIDLLAKIYPTPGYSSEIIYIYVAKDFTPCATHFDEDEFLNLVKIPFSEAKQMAKDGRIKDAKTVIALLSFEK